MANPIKTPEQLLAYRPLKELIAGKGDAVHAAAPADSVYSALQTMSAHHIGFLVVLEGTRLVGVVSERDCARKVDLQDRSAKTTSVRDIMTTEVVTVGPDQTIPQCMALMHSHGFRHLPVVDRGTVVGVLSIRDLMRVVLEDSAPRGV